MLLRVRVCIRLILLKMSLYLVFRNKSGASRYWCIMCTRNARARCFIHRYGTYMYIRYFKLRHGLYDAVFCAVLPKDLFNLFVGGCGASSHAVWLYTLCICSKCCRIPSTSRWGYIFHQIQIHVWKIYIFFIKIPIERMIL